MNIAATTLYVTSYVLRKSDSRAAGQTCALAGYGIAIGAAWFGGVINGPATQNQPCLDVRERSGQIEVKARD